MKRMHSACVFLVAGLFLTLNPLLSARTFKTLAGVSIEASLVEVKSGGADQIVVLKLDRSARPYEIPLARLSPADQDFIKYAHLLQPSSRTVASARSKAVPAVSGASIFTGLASQLVAVEGRRVKKHQMENEPEYYAFYFAAGWCHACSRFTSMLAKYYTHNIAFAQPQFEIVFVSRDNSKQEMDDYMLKSGMPWPAISYSASVREQLIKKYAPSGTPSLVLVDRAGKVISESFVDGKPRGAFAVKQDMAFWFTGGERTGTSTTKSDLTSDKRVSD